MVYPTKVSDCPQNGHRMSFSVVDLEVPVRVPKNRIISINSTKHQKGTKLLRESEDLARSHNVFLFL